MIEVHNLTKEYQIMKRQPGLSGAIKSLFVRDYETKQAVKGIDFSIQKGEMVGYIGANGAGKSTTIKMMAGILTPTSGEVRINGVIPYKNRRQNAKNIGAVFGQRTQLFWDIPVRESYSLIRHIYEVPEQEYKQRLEMFAEVLELGSLLGIPVRQLSLGQKMRCELGAAFLHNPDVVFLDEPTIGLDVNVKSKIRQFIRKMNALQNTTILLTTHDMQDIEEICNRIIIIDSGSILYDGGMQQIKNRFGDKRTITFDLEGDQPTVVSENLRHVASVTETAEGGLHQISVEFSSQAISAAEVISEMMKINTIRDLTITDSNIESIVKDIYERGM